MPFSTIDSPKKYFDTTTYTGNGASPRSIGGLSFKPDLVWSKSRSTAENHNLYDAVRGGANGLRSNLTNAENASSIYGYVSTFDSNGVTYISGGTNNDLNNGNGVTFVNWNWLASNTTVSNTSGTISSTVSANTTSGFSIVSYTGTGASATVGHGLGVVPKMIICKARSIGYSWEIYHASLGNTQYLRFNTSATDTSAQMWNSTTPTSSVFSLGTEDTNTSGQTHIAYCFAEVKGFSKFGSYTGNGSNDGTYVHLGFTPAFVMTRRTDSAENWAMFDNKRDGFNVNNRIILANTSDTENTTNTYLDLLSNGFKARSTSGAVNSSGGNYIYMAFASSPFTSSKGICATAK